MKERLIILFGGVLMSILGFINPEWYYEFILQTFKKGIEDLTKKEILILFNQ